jgi:hypothetical protein
MAGKRRLSSGVPPANHNNIKSFKGLHDSNALAQSM